MPNYGWKRQDLDLRDLRLTVAPPHIAATYPAQYTVPDYFGPVMDQGQLGSCTCNSSGEAVLWNVAKTLGNVSLLNGWTPARLQMYYDVRKMEGTTSTDSGAVIRDVFKMLSKSGAADEKLWPYDVTKFADAPTDSVNKDALTHLLTRYAAVDQTINAMKSCLVNSGPFVAGFEVFPEFEGAKVAKDGLVPMPKRGSRSIGGHAILVCGWDDNKIIARGTKGAAWCRNSWGDKWGLGGYFWLPYAYLMNKELASDFWCPLVVNFAAPAGKN